jgi:hypothetical protein
VYKKVKLNNEKLFDKLLTAREREGVGGGNEDV